jgi:hypothetical protein
VHDQVAGEEAMSKPHFGFTRTGHAVHGSIADYHKSDTAFQRFNKKVATRLTRTVGSMPAFYWFNLLALLSLPATFHLMNVIPLVHHAHGLLVVWNFCLSYGWIFLITWICQNYIQLVLLPAIMTYQSIQGDAADARAAKTFEDAEEILREIREIKETLSR